MKKEIYKNKEFKNKNFDKIVIDQAIIKGDCVFDNAIYYAIDRIRPPSEIPAYKNCTFIDCTVKEAHIITNVTYKRGIEILQELTTK